MQIAGLEWRYLDNMQKTEIMAIFLEVQPNYETLCLEDSSMYALGITKAESRWQNFPYLHILFAKRTHAPMFIFIHLKQTWEHSL